MPSVSFFEQYEWDDERRAMKFWAKADGETLTCWIHASALSPTAEAEAEDREQSRQEYFMHHIDRIHTLARQLITNGELDDNGEVCIDAAAVKRLGA